MLRFGIWSLLCLFGSTDFAGNASHAALGYVLRLLGFLLETGGTAAASITLFWQKGAHVVLFSVLGMLSASERKLWYWGAGLTVCAGAEWLQAFTLTRHVSVIDAALNVLCFGLGGWVTLKMRRAAVRPAE